MTKESKITPEVTDGVVSAEIPNRDSERHCHTILTSKRTPSGGLNQLAVCMKSDSCSDAFRSFLKETEHRADSYPKYRRRSHETTNRFKDQLTINERSCTIHDFDCHKKFCTSAKSIKYVLF
ncbi:hypothetical protein RRG08_049859 [Elysia crispata]|uniref:Uncharacterized protein n=1 Tax=Elysia crispata TaxID=231223 RepID=A0AAE1DMU4_9GAST|nr:hypothetical protein RRG08_049859 [Elysia crispata]